MMKKRKIMRCENGKQLCDKGTVSEGDREKSAATALVAKLTHSFQMKCLMSLVVNDSVATNDFFSLFSECELVLGCTADC